MSIQLRDGLANQSVDLVLEDLLVRFLVNVPDEDLSSIERVFFQVEEAQWFYTDFMRQLNPMLPGMKMKTFASSFLEKCPLIWKWGDPHDALSRFGKYKQSIPVRGIALFNKDLSKVILVKGTESNSWSFPRGKISKDESDIDCAIRETEEETGFNARDLINENDVVERTIKGKNYKIYLVKNVPEDYDFQPLGRNEIAKIQWHDIKSIQKKANSNNYFIVGTVIKPIMKWINKSKGELNEEDLMWRAEVKLKSLLGINSEPVVNVDAGRELLNILQKVAPQNDNPAPTQHYIQMHLPQHLQNPVPFFNNPGVPFYNPLLQPNFVPPHHPGNNFPPQMTPLPSFHAPPPYPGHSPDGFQSQSTPAPQSLVKPTPKRSTEANSRELLSILNKPSKKAEDKDKSPNLMDTQSNRSKADHLLSLFKKKEETGESPSQTIMNIINKKENAENSKEFKNLLTKSPEEDPTQSILSLLNKPKQQAQPRTPQSQSNSLLDTYQPSNVLEETLREPSFVTNDPGKKLTLLKRSDQANSSGNNSAELLSLLGRPPSKPEAKSKQEHASSKELLSLLKGPARPEPAPKTSSQELLGLLNKKPLVPVQATKAAAPAPAPAPAPLEIQKPVITEHSNDFDDFDNFENFEDFDDFDDQFLPKNLYHNFDIASDEEDVDHLIDDISKITSEQAYNNVREEPKKIRLLKPGETLNDALHGSIQTNQEPKTNAQGNSLLALLNKKSPDGEQKPVNSYHSIYGNAHPPAEPSFPLNNHSIQYKNNNSAELMKELFWKRDGN